MNLIFTILFAKAVKFNPRKTGKAIRKDAKFLVQLITEIVELIHIILGFVIKAISYITKKIFCQCKTVEESTSNKNVINFADYKNKKKVG